MTPFILAIIDSEILHSSICPAFIANLAEFTA